MTDNFFDDPEEAPGLDYSQVTPPEDVKDPFAPEANYNPPAPSVDENMFSYLDAEIEAAPMPEISQSVDLPEGKYTFFVSAARADELKNGANAGRPVVNISLCVMAGPCRGMIQDKTWFLTDEQSMGFFKKDLAMLAIDVSAMGIKYSQLISTHRHVFLDRVVEGRVKRTSSKKDISKSYVNVYLDRFVPDVQIPVDLQQIAQQGGLKPASGGSGAPVAF